jgi:hypothetical protein
MQCRQIHNIFILQTIVSKTGDVRVAHNECNEKMYIYNVHFWLTFLGHNKCYLTESTTMYTGHGEYSMNKAD